MSVELLSYSSLRNEEHSYCAPLRSSDGLKPHNSLTGSRVYIDTMALGELMIRDLHSPTLLLLSIILTAILLQALYRLSPLHSLSHVPGPYLPRISSLWLTYHSWCGDEASVVHALHQRYGRTVRTGPNTVDIADGEALHAIYVDKGGFRKPKFYLNFMVDGHRTIFSEIVPENRAPKAKVVLPAFSMASLRQGRHLVYECARRWVDVMRIEADLGQPVDVLGLSRSFALDALCEYLFGMKLGALEIDRAGLLERQSGQDLESKRERADGMIDVFDSAGRYWYLPPWAFTCLEWLRLQFFSDDALFKTFGVMENFAHKAVDAAVSQKQDLAWTYAGRLLQAGLTESIARAESKDALLAGVDTPGYNLAIILFNLTKHKDKYDTLRREILDTNPTDDEVQSLPYLRGVIQEGLRISTANPTRFPRIVPTRGWHFQDTFFPAGAEVSCSSFELHNNPAVFENPNEFKPERWLNASIEMNRDYIPFSTGSRRCIALNFALMELYCAVHVLVREDVLAGAQCCKEKIEIMEWFNIKVVGGRIDLKWE